MKQTDEYTVILEGHNFKRWLSKQEKNAKFQKMYVNIPWPQSIQARKS